MPFTPDAARSWDLQSAGHLYRRAAFGGTWKQLQQALKDGPNETVARLLHPAADVAAFDRSYDQLEKMDAEEASTEQHEAIWLRRMTETPHPLQEQMTLFWHSFFGVTNERVSRAALMCKHVRVLRKNALGNFEILLKEVLNEPAMAVCWDAKSSRKVHPNETLPRVLLEQYTVGPGKYSQQDVLELGRALSGRVVQQNAMTFVEREYDSGTKTILGRKGAFDLAGAIQVLLQQPATADTVVRRVYRYFVSEVEHEANVLLIKLLAEQFHKDYDINKLMRTVLRSNLFFSTLAYRSKIKSPVELAMSILRPLESAAGGKALSNALGEMGQDIYQPPSVKGWAGGRFWLNRFTMAARTRLVQNLMSTGSPLGGQTNPVEMAQQQGRRTPDEMARFFSELWLQGDLPEESRRVLLETAAGAGRKTDANPGTQRSMAALVLSLPEFQMS